MSHHQQDEQERGVRADSPTNQLRLWHKQRRRKRTSPVLTPVGLAASSWLECSLLGPTS
jgi:hypothetical protein